MQSLKPTPGTRQKQLRPQRSEYLDQLVTEFHTSESRDAKEQVLANLANFAYDPFNYEYFRTLNILDLFLDNLTSPNVNIIKFSIGGLCNLCLDPTNKKYILENGLTKLVNLINHENEDIMVSVITTLMFLVTPESKQDITKESIIQSMQHLATNQSPRIRNLATIFLEDYCPKKPLENHLQPLAKFPNIPPSDPH